MSDPYREMVERHDAMHRQAMHFMGSFYTTCWIFLLTMYALDKMEIPAMGYSWAWCCFFFAWLCYRTSVKS